MLLRAPIVIPVSRRPIANGAVVIAGGRILEVGTFCDLSRRGGEVIDLEDQILLPGLINAHCHLDYTNMAGRLPPPKAFPDWVKALLALKSEWSYADYARSWIDGAKMLIRSGTTMVGDIEAVPELLPEVWSATPVRVMSFLEMTGVRSRRSPEDILAEASHRVVAPRSERNGTGLSPHAPYSTTGELLRRVSDFSRQSGRRVAIHVSESEPEFDMFMYRRGSLFDWLKDQRDASDCGQGSPLQHVERAGLVTERTLLVHCNYLWDPDAQLIARGGAHVVHCPRSHSYFGHRRFPRRELVAAGVNVCLGTDSLASVRKRRGQSIELDMFAEMRALAAGASGFDPAEIIRMATRNGAHALGFGGQAGELSPSAWADLIAVPITDAKADPETVVLQHQGPVSAVMIGGQWVVPPAGSSIPPRQASQTMDSVPSNYS